MARIIDGKGIAEVIRKEMKDEVALLTKEGRARDWQ